MEIKENRQVLNILDATQIPDLSTQQYYYNSYSEIRIQVKNASCVNVKECEFRKITSFLQKINPNRLEVLVVSFECSEGLAEKLHYSFEEIFELRRALSPLVKKIRVFELNLNNWGYQNARLMPDHCFPQLFQDLYKQMEQIEELSIRLKAIEHNNITSINTLYSLVDHLKFDKLKKLSIDIEHPANIFFQLRFQPAQFERFFQTIADKGQNLQSLHLNINRFNLNARSIQILNEGLKKMQNLVEISILLRQKDDIEDNFMMEQFGELYKTIFKLPNIKQIEFEQTLHNTAIANENYIQQFTMFLIQNQSSLKFKKVNLKINSMSFSESLSYIKFLMTFGRFFGREIQDFPFVLRIGSPLFQRYERAFNLGLASRVQLIGIVKQMQKEKYLSQFRQEIIYDLYETCF